MPPSDQIAQDIKYLTSKLSPYLLNKKIIEIKLNEPDEISLLYSDNSACKKKIDIDESSLLCFGKALATHTGQKFSSRYPSLATKLPGMKARIQMMMPPRIKQGISFCIRLGIGKKVPLEAHFPEREERHAFLDILLSKKNFLISGSTGSGKTTFANSILEWIPKDEWLVTVEDTEELHPPHKNVFGLLVSRSASDDAHSTEINAIDDALRLNPGRLILGEISSRNASAFMTAINLGNPAFTTIHANSADTAIIRLAKAVKDSGGSYKEALNQAQQFIEAVVHLEQLYGNFSANMSLIE